MLAGLRWFGSRADTVSLAQIRQIPGVKGVISTLYDKKPEDVWTKEEVKALKSEIEAAGLKLLGIESVNVSDDIKAATKDRDEHIENYIKSLTALGENGVDLVCYNFMPVFDWTRSELHKAREDGSNVLAYDQNKIDEINPETIFSSIDKMADGHMLPGWEPERMARIKELFDLYSDTNDEVLFDNLVYFLEAIWEVCKKYNIRMAIHPDDPAWPVFGLPRIITNEKNLLRLIKVVDKPHNGVTLCTGSLGSNPDNDIPATIRALGSRIYFAHIRNLRHKSKGVFEEAAHYEADGSLDITGIMRAFYDIDYKGVMRPDHGRMIWGEKAMPGYGLYDRALGVQYLLGIWDALCRNL